MVTRELKCADCRVVATEEPNTFPEMRPPCPSCGSKARLHEVQITERVALHAKVRVKAVHSGKGRPFYEALYADDLHRKSGKWMYREMVVDRRANRYQERVIDRDTGVVVHACDEPLTRHQGHGTARRRKPE